MNDTFQNARRNGGGVVLTDGIRRYKVSDWSEGTRTVFGHVMREGEWVDYQRLPQGLIVWEPTIVPYEESDMRAPEGSPADVAMRAGIAADQGPEFGESPDVVTRTRRRLRGKDGLRDDIHDLARPFHDEIALIGEAARHVAADLVRVRLVRLEEVLHNHRFTAVSQHFDAYSLMVSPPLRGFGAHPKDRICGLVHKEGWLHRPEAPFQDLATWISSISDEISMIMTGFGDDFSIDVGVVTSDRDHDVATCYGAIAQTASDEEMAGAED